MPSHVGYPEPPAHAIGAQTSIDTPGGMVHTEPLGQNPPPVQSIG